MTDFRNPGLPEDHEQDERDYYDRESEKHLNSCLFSFKSLAVLTILFLIGYLLFGCASTGPRATHSVGTVTVIDGDMVLVTFPVATEGYADQAANWFYIPGHSYQVRDKYPDPDKDPALRLAVRLSGVEAQTGTNLQHP